MKTKGLIPYPGKPIAGRECLSGYFLPALMIGLSLLTALLPYGCVVGPKFKQGAIVEEGGGRYLATIISPESPLAGALSQAAGGAIPMKDAPRFMDKECKDLVKALQPEIASGKVKVRLQKDHSLRITTKRDAAFAQGSAKLNPSYATALRKTAEIVKTHGSTTISVIGYPDQEGNRMERRALADSRAEAVRSTLVSLGVSPILITASGTEYLNDCIEMIIQPLLEQ